MFTVPRLQGFMPPSVGIPVLALSGTDWRPILAVAAAVLLALLGGGSFEVVVAAVAVARTGWVYTNPGKAGKGGGKADKMAFYQADAISETVPPRCRPKLLTSPGEGDPGLDFQAFLGSLEQHCDSALDGLCDQAMVEQGASVLVDLERDYESFGDGALLTRQLDTELPRDVVPEPEDEQDRAYDDVCDSYLADLELDMELHRDVVPEPEDEQDRAYDDVCDSYLADFELDMELHRDVVPEPEGERDRAYDDLYASYMADLEELDWRLFGDVESAAGRQLLHGRLSDRIRGTVAEYAL